MSTLKDVISEAIFGWGLRNDDGHNLSMDDTDEIAEYIVTRTPQPVVPEGYVLVPVEPTEAMLRAGLGWREVDPDEQIRNKEADMCSRIWQAMLSAAKGGEA
jgi:hypothetical protein